MVELKEKSEDHQGYYTVHHLALAPNLVQTVMVPQLDVEICHWLSENSDLLVALDDR